MSRPRRKRGTKNRRATSVPTSSSPIAAPSAGRWLWPLVLVAASVVVFKLTLAPTVTAEDSGELIAAAWHFGIPHPPGYPLWTMLCGVFIRACSVGSIAARANLFSAVCSTGAAVLFYFALRQLKLSRPIAVGSAMTWIFCRWSWSQSVITEVYALNSLLTAGVFLCALRWYTSRGTRPLLVASLLMGLGMSNHHVIALAGIALVLWILVLKPSLLKRWRLVLGCIGLFEVGLIPYLYLPLRARTNPTINWGNPATLKSFMEHVTRHQYGAVGPIKTPEPRSVERFVGQLGYLAESIADDMTPWLAGLSLVGVVVLGWKDRRILVLVMLWLCCTGALFALLANYDSDRTSRWAMRVFLIPVSLGMVIPLAFLLDSLVTGMRKTLGPRPASSLMLASALAVAAPTVQLASHWRHCDYSNYWLAYDHARNLLSCMKPDAMVFPSGDHDAFSLTYLVMVEGQRQDVLIADIYGYTRPDLYAAKKTDASETPEAWLIRTQRRPVYYNVKKSPPVAGAHFVNAGLLYHLQPDHMSFDAAGLMEACSYRNPEAPSVMDYGADHIMVQYRFFSGLAELQRGNFDAAMEHFHKAAEHGHGIREVFNNLGSALGEHGQDEHAERYFEQAAAFDPRYALPRWNLFRLATKRGDHERAKGYLNEILHADPKNIRALDEMSSLRSRRRGDPTP